jgi:hypothetical protein
MRTSNRQGAFLIHNIKQPAERCGSPEIIDLFCKQVVKRYRRPRLPGLNSIESLLPREYFAIRSASLPTVNGSCQ